MYSTTPLVYFFSLYSRVSYFSLRQEENELNKFNRNKEIISLLPFLSFFYYYSSSFYTLFILFFFCLFWFSNTKLMKTTTKMLLFYSTPPILTYFFLTFVSYFLFLLPLALVICFFFSWFTYIHSHFDCTLVTYVMDRYI